MKKLIFLFVAVLTLSGVCSAHQPRLVRKQLSTEANPVIVSNPEISQAFYGILSGQEQYYQIHSDTGFLLYVNIVVPDLPGQRTDFIVDIMEGNAAIYTRLDGRRFPRTGFYEEFAGDQYLRGPERERNVPAGTYTIVVSNADNQGKYSLAIGKKESFTFRESVKTIGRLPALKTVFFDKPRRAVSQGIIGKSLTVLAGILILVLILVLYFIFRKKHVTKPVSKPIAKKPAVRKNIRKKKK